MKTAMQDLIEVIEIIISVLPDEALGAKNQAIIIKTKAESLLQKEKQQILDSHYDAAIQIIKLKFPDKVERCNNDFEDAEQYYNETFNQ